MSDVDHTREDIIRAARHALVAGEPIDIGRVAAAAGVDRTTVFRRVGRRDAVMAEALWSTTERLAWPACLAAHPPGVPDRAAHVLGAYVQMLVQEEWFRLFLHRDPRRALRILTTDASPIQARMTVLVAELIASEPEPSIELTTPALALALMRVAETFIYADLITGSKPDAETAHTIFVALLKPRPTEMEPPR